MAILRVPDEAKRIQLNRAGGESYDQGTQMTMAEAIKIAEQYGHVPARISSGAMPDDTTGVWAIPTAQGWVPLDQLTAQESWSRNGGSAQQQQQQAGSNKASQALQAVRNGPSTASTVGSNIAAQSNGTATQGALAPRPPAMGQQQPYERGLGWLNRPGVPQTPSTSGPITGGQRPPQFQTPVQPGSYQQGQQPVINVNVGGVPGGQYTGAGGQYDPSGWYTASPQFQTGPREDAIRNQVYNGTPTGFGPPDLSGPRYNLPGNPYTPNLTGMQATPPAQYTPPIGGSTVQMGEQQVDRQISPGGPQPYEQGIQPPRQAPYGGGQWGPGNLLANIAGPSLGSAMGASPPNPNYAPPSMNGPRYQFPQNATGSQPFQPVIPPDRFGNGAYTNRFYPYSPMWAGQ